MDCASTTPSSRRVTRWLIPVALVTMASVPIVSWALDDRVLSPPVRLALAMIPVFLWGILVVLLVMGVHRTDELQRRIQLDALAMAYPTAMMIGMLVEYLQKAGFVLDWNVGDVWPFMALLYAPAWFVARWRYR